MTWKRPESEEQWEELLSAFADGELDPDTASALESYLKQDEKRAEQLRSIRRTSELLQSWSVDAPTMDAALRESIASPTENASRPSPLRGLWRMAAVFAAGVFTGVAVMNAGSPVEVGTPDVATVHDRRLNEVAIPSDHADVLLKEVAAAELSRRIERDATQSRWKDAQDGVARMQSHYADTNAAQEFAAGHAGRRIVRQLLGRSS